MRFGFFSLFLLLSVGLFGQPVIEAPVWAPQGFTADIIAGNHFAPTPAGDEPQSWDFSGVSGSAVSLLVVEPAALSPYVDAFTDADWTFTNGDQLSFWNLNDDVFTVVGNANAANGVTLPFDDPLIQRTYPLEYGNVESDSIGIELTLFGAPYSLSGEASFEVDAWGSIVLPDGTVHDEVLRGDYLQVYQESYDGDTNVWVVGQVMYFVSDSLMPVFLHEELTVTSLAGDVLLEVTDVAWYANHVLSVEAGLVESVSAPYPNPVRRGEDVNWTLPRGWSWEAITMDGRVVARGNVEPDGRVMVPTVEWESGLVLLVPVSPDGEPGGKPARVFVD